MSRRRWQGRALLVAGGVIVGATAVAAAIGPWLVPFDPAAQELPLRLAGPTAAHPFGLDELGRDILARVLAGARLSFAVGIAVVSVSASVGTLLGAIAPHFRGITSLTWRSSGRVARTCCWR
jgi:peptide/nickel transport system permease protein